VPNIQIFIPSRSRWQNVRTLFNLSEQLWPLVSVVVPYSQFTVYRASLPRPVDIIPFSGEGIHTKRDFILHLKPDGKIIMMDDDLKFYKRTGDGTRFPGTHPQETEEMMDTLIYLLDHYPMVGLTDKFMSQTKPRPVMECHRFNQVLGFNRDLLPNPWPKFRVPHDEEHDFHLQLLTRGYKTSVLTEWSKSDKSDAPGGCSDWRNETVLRQAHEKLMELWPGIVTIDTSKEKPKARYNWKAAKMMGGI
jgi:hypothetical protein